ncbi:MAG TPA: DmsE family decaheme c-type cytochrome, partial [Dissulfurispiraceae bacterium]
MQKKCAACVLFSFLVLLVSASVSGGSEAKTGIKEGFVGAETCRGCHEKQYDSYARTVHSKKYVKGPAFQGACETCHGPGKRHVEKGGGRGVDIFAYGANVDPKAKSAKCLECHEEAKPLEFWDRSRHTLNNISCDNCHDPHGRAERLLKGRESELCSRCHQDIRAQFDRQTHHPVKEELMKCSDCHNVHGGFGRKMIKADTVNELCYECHSEKRGPFMWEHPPVEKKCLTCHEAHGSNHVRLLERKVPQLCESCHDVGAGGGHMTEAYTSFHTFNGTATGDKNKFYGRSCLNCHTNIHGSNGPA